MTPLKLLALDSVDLSILSAHVQDSVLRVGDIDWRPQKGRFTLVLGRFVWEEAENVGDRRRFERRLAALSFARVKRVASHRIRRDASEAVLDLMAVEFQGREQPGGMVVLTFAGGGAIRLEVECIEAQLCDLGAKWPTGRKPAHDLSTLSDKPAHD